MNTQSPLAASESAPEIDPGIAPADLKPHAPWPRWKVYLAYAVLFAVAMGSIWLIDTHVMSLSQELAAEGTTTPAPRP